MLSLITMEAVFEKSIMVEEEMPEEEESTLSKLGSTISKLFSGEGSLHGWKSGSLLLTDFQSNFV